MSNTAMPKKFSSSKAPRNIYGGFFPQLNLSIHPRVENHQHFHFMKLLKKIARQKIFSDILTIFVI